MKKIFLTIREDYIHKRKEKRDSFDQRLISWISKLKIRPIILSNNFNYNELDKKGISGVIISGGGDSRFKTKRKALETKLIKCAQKNKKPILGICYGMQLIGKLNGARLKKIEGHVKKTNKIISENHYKFPKKVTCFHNFVLANCPKNFEVIARSKDNLIEAIKHKTQKCEAWMWHPERETRFNPNLIKRAKNLFK